MSDMTDIRFQVLTSRDDLKQYQEKTAQAVSVELPMDYLVKARVVGLKDQATGQIYGGFTMAFDGPLRCLEQLPEEVWQDSHPLKKHRDRCFEINGLWLNHRDAPGDSRIQLYLHCMKEALKLASAGKYKYVYAYCAENESLRRFYKNFNSIELYEGPVATLPGMKKAGRERVEMGCMKRLPLNILRNPQFLVSRAFGGFRRRRWQWPDEESA